MDLYTTLDAIDISGRIDQDADTMQTSVFTFLSEHRSWQFTVIKGGSSIQINAYVALIAPSERPMRRLALLDQIAKINCRQIVKFYVTDMGAIRMAINTLWNDIEPEQLRALIYALLDAGRAEYSELLGVLSGSADLERLAASFNNEAA